jgi:hypothetical protein
VIGVYEPVIAIGGGRQWSTSLAQEPHLRSGEDVIIHHECAAVLWPELGDEEALG